jgi:hypothetical protein
MPIYENAPPEVGEIISRMLFKYHGPLEQAGTRIDIVFAKACTDDNGDTKGPALKLHGYPCGAIARVISLKDRSKGMGDVEISVDGDQWDTWSEEEKEALIDHELEHFELRVKDGAVVRDDLDRPKIRMKKHDHQFGWFDAIARRHGPASFEVQQFRAFSDANRQTWLSFMEGGVGVAGKSRRKAQ